MTASGSMLVPDDRVERYKRIAQAEIEVFFPNRRSLTETQQRELTAIESYTSRNDHLHLGILYSSFPDSGDYNLRLKDCLLNIIRKSIAAGVISDGWRDSLQTRLGTALKKAAQSPQTPSVKEPLASPAKQSMQAGNPNAFHKTAPPPPPYPQTATRMSTTSRPLPTPPARTTVPSAPRR